MDEMIVDIIGNNKTKDNKAVSKIKALIAMYTTYFHVHKMIHICQNKTEMKQTEDDELA